MRFGKKTLDIFCYALIPSYLFNIVNALIHIGPANILQYLITTTYLRDTGFNSFFEMHDYGLSIGLLIMYQLFFREDGPNWWVTIILALWKIFCWKRIALFALALCLMIYPFVRKEHIWQKNRKIYTLMLIVAATCFCFIMFIASSDMIALMMNYGVDYSDRMHMINNFRDFYEWSVSFCGNGFHFMDKYMRDMGTAVHNDIFTIYVDLGFIGFIAWFAFNMLAATKILDKHYGHSVSFTYVMVTTYSHVVYMTDNTARYFLFQFFIYSILMQSIFNAYEKQKLKHRT